MGVVDSQGFKNLLIALVFHQFLEGVALGARFAEMKDLSFWKELLFALVFSLAAPVGVAVGIGLVSSLNLSGATYLTTQGTLDSLCGGILLYIGFSMLVKDFAEDAATHAAGDTKDGGKRTLRPLYMFAAMWVGAGGLAVIGKWA
jgi:zinc transporter 1/2/3